MNLSPCGNLFIYLKFLIMVALLIASEAYLAVKYMLMNCLVDLSLHIAINVLSYNQIQVLDIIFKC